MLMTRALMSSLAVICSVAACGGDDGGGSTGTVDAALAIDAALDAPAAKQIGAACTQSQTDLAGDCGAGMACIATQGGSGAWCTKMCTAGAGDTGAMGYTGPGLAGCLLQLTLPNNGGSLTVCGVVCSTTDPMQCPTCNNTCPGALSCSQPVMNGGGMTIGQACK